MRQSHSQSWHHWFECFAIVAMLTAGPALADSAPAAQAAPQAATTSSSAIPGATIVTLPADTPVIVSLKQPVSSATANVGDIVPIAVAQEVDYSGYVVIAKGADGQATVSAVEHAGGNGHGGKITLTMDWVYGKDGSKIGLANTNQNGGSGDKKGAASTATIASYVLLGPIGLFAHNFVHGKDVTIGTDKTFNMYTDHAVSIAELPNSSPAVVTSPAPSPSANLLSGMTYIG